MPLDDFYWALKKWFPGDVEFTFENFRHLPIEYVVEAYSRGNRLRRLELHEYERPHSLHMAMVANHNRNEESRSEPFSPEDFFLYQPNDQENLPDHRYGAAAIALIEDDLFPSWALFCYKALAARSGGVAPPLLAFMSEDAILLAPIPEGNGFKGLLIAREAASEQWVLMKSPCGKEETLQIPRIGSKVIASEDMVLARR